MNYIIAVFSSRFSTLNFANCLRDVLIPCAIINTPQSIQKVCGISVKFLKDHYPKVQELVAKRGGLRNFVGFFANKADAGVGQQYERF